MNHDPAKHEAAQQQPREQQGGKQQTFRPDAVEKEARDEAVTEEATHPIARPADAPVAASQTRPEPTTHADTPDSSEGTVPPFRRNTNPLKTTSARPTPASSSSKPGRHQRALIAQSLSRRDQDILTSIAAHRLITTRQLQRLHFSGHASLSAGTRATNRVLHRLHGHRLISMLDRRVGGSTAGSTCSIWHLSHLGERLLADANPGAPAPRYRLANPSLQYLDHLLAITDTRLVLLAADRAGLIELDRIQLEPACWRSYQGTHGPAKMQPDLAIVYTRNGYEHHAYLEVDLDTEHLPVILRKCHSVQAYYTTGTEQDRLGLFPLTIWITPTSRRRDRIREAIQNAANLSTELFWVITAQEFAETFSSEATSRTTS